MCCALQVSFGPISWLIVGEVFPLAVRGPASALATLTNFGSNFVVRIAPQHSSANLMSLIADLIAECGNSMQPGRIVSDLTVFRDVCYDTIVRGAVILHADRFQRLELDVGIKMGAIKLIDFVTALQVSLVLPSIQDAFGPGATYLTFAAVGLIAVGTIAAVVPETKGKTLEEIEALFDEKSE